MLTPKTYKGYDKDGKVVAQYTAVDANQYINPNEVKSAISNVKSVFKDQMNSVATALTGISADATEAVIVQGTKMDTVINETAQALNKIPDQVMKGISSLYDKSVEAHDKIQKKANEEAYSAAASIDGVVRVSG